MKAEINNENKAKFFALYLNQKVLCDNLRSNERLDKSWNWSHKDFWIQLKPLSSISDEDATWIAKVYGGFYDTKEDLKDYKDHINLALIEDDEEAHNWWDHIGFQTMIQVNDYLRSKGYALPWMGLSVEDIVEAGWIKLIEA